MELVHPQQLPAQPGILVHGGVIPVDGVDQVGVHLHRHLGGIQSGGQGVGILPGIRKELQLLGLGVQGGGAGVAELP